MGNYAKLNRYIRRNGQKHGIGYRFFMYQGRSVKRLKKLIKAAGGDVWDTIEATQYPFDDMPNRKRTVYTVTGYIPDKDDPRLDYRYRGK